MPKLSHDKKWEMFNKRLEKFMKLNDFFGLGTTYYEMADFQKKEGKDNNQMRGLGYKMKLKITEEELRRYSESGVLEKVEILSAPDSCNLCKKLTGKIISIKDAMTQKPIPNEKCEHKYGCRCGY